MELCDFFKTHNKVALAYSGGVDSAYLLYECSKADIDYCAYFVKSSFQPEWELNEAVNFASSLGAKLHVLSFDTLGTASITCNDSMRCYYCKSGIMSIISEASRKDGYTQIIDGTNASDLEGDRPGMMVLKEMGILSPLKLCGLTKSEIRHKCRESGIKFWDKPSYSCLATRIASNEEITSEKLKKIDAAESYLFRAGYNDFRVRLINGSAKLQFTDEYLNRALASQDEITHALSSYFNTTTIDNNPRKKSS